MEEQARQEEVQAGAKQPRQLQKKKKNSEKTVKPLRSRYKKITSWGKKYIGLMNMQESSIHINLYTNKSRCFSFFGKATSILLAIPCPDYCQTR